MIYLIWIIFSIGIGVVANSKGRNGFGWTILSLAASPIIGLILILVLPDLEELRRQSINAKIDFANNIKEIEKNEQEKINESMKIEVTDFSSSFEKLQSLVENNILSADEFSLRKLKVIDDLKVRILTVEPDVFLTGLIPIYKKKIITDDELKKIKSIIYKDVA